MRRANLAGYPKRMNKILIVIVNWNIGELLSRCLESLRNLPEQDIISQIVVVDNASTDPSVSLALDHPPLRKGRQDIIKLAQNLGFAKANNLGITKHWNGQDHILLLNPDTEVLPSALANMLAVLDQNKTIGIVGPKLLNPDGSLQGSVRPFPTRLDFLLYMLKLGRAVQSRQEKAYDYSKTGPVDQVMGAAFLIRNEIWKTIGPLDESFFTLFEEVDYCRRAKNAGWQTYFTPAAEIKHVRAASFDQLIGWQRSAPWLASLLHYARKHFGTVFWLLLICFVPMYLLLTAPATLKHMFLKSRNQRRL